jgi:hypothetical protein
MINLLCDEAYAFDYLSILEVKRDMDPSNSSKSFTYFECASHLQKQLNDKFKTIIDSVEYKELYDKNVKVFKLIDRLRAHENISAATIDDANMERFFAKMRLQHKFFSGAELKEVKINYNVTK